MKKLSVILSVLLCLSAMVTGVSAKSTGEILTGGDALAIYEKCMKKIGKAEYLEIRGFSKEFDSDFWPPKATRKVWDLKLVTTPDNKLQMESQMWDASGKRTVYQFADNNCSYDSIEFKRYKNYDLSLKEIIYALTGTKADSYKDDIKNLKAEKIDGGYRLRYHLFAYEDNEDKYTLVIGDDFKLKSITNVFNFDEPESTSYRYEILSINRPFKIKFPADLSRYDLV